MEEFEKLVTEYKARRVASGVWSANAEEEQDSEELLAWVVENREKFMGNKLAEEYLRGYDEYKRLVEDAPTKEDYFGWLAKITRSVFVWTDKENEFLDSLVK